jgi:predicted nuclease of predicted toxin-antitoxin system
VRILLDACVPRQLGRDLGGHEVRTAAEMGWGDLDDRPLLDSMAGLFDALVTVDKGLLYQQRIAGRSFGVVLLRATSNRLADLLPLVPALREALSDLLPGEFREVSARGV